MRVYDEPVDKVDMSGARRKASRPRHFAKVAHSRLRRRRKQNQKVDISVHEASPASEHGCDATRLDAVGVRGRASAPVFVARSAPHKGQVTFAPKVTLPLPRRSRYLCPKGQVTFAPKVR